jgi:hypothetical protein
MRAGILIIGSLLWDDQARGEWRCRRLRLENRVHVNAPIRYGRRSGSWGNAFTMTFAPYRALGQAVLVPCTACVEHICHLVDEAEALWEAESRKASKGGIGASWGCVGVLFRGECVATDLRNAWTRHFRRWITCPIPPVDSNGLLGIPWPTTSHDNRPVDADVILATATSPDPCLPTPPTIADAWVDQHCGYERYFFENLRHGIRTPDDQEIWNRIEARRPPWLDCHAYAEPIGRLRAEAARAA